MPTFSSQHAAHSAYDHIESSPYYDVYRGPDGQIYVDWTGTPDAGDPSNWFRSSFWHQWAEDGAALLGGAMPRDWQNAIDHIRDTYGPESGTVHHIGYSRGGAFAEMFGGTGYGAMTNPAMPIAPGAHDEAGEDWIHNWLHNHHGTAPFTPSPNQAGIPMATPTTPGQIPVPHNVIEMFGNDNNGHSLITAQAGMPFGNSTYGGSLSGRSRFRSSYPANQTRRQTEQFGDLNAHNRVYQFYNYHGEKKQMLNEYCRGLVLSMVRIQKGVVHDYDDPIAWPFPIHQPEAQVTGTEPQDQHLDQYLNWVEFHFKDARRDGGFYGKTLGNRTGTEGGVIDEEPLASQYQYDILINKPTCVQLWRYVNPDDHSEGKRMKSLIELAYDMTEVFETLAYLDTNFNRAHDAADPDVGTPHVDSLDIRPTRIMLIKSLRSGGKLTHDVIYDDEQFASSRVDVGSYTTVTIHNVSPASGDIAVAADPMAADTITHVPLVGKMYTFSGSCPKVWDKHKADLHQLFNPLFFRNGRYRLPKSKIHDKDVFKSPPRGRAIWSNCIGESRIGIGPGQLKKLRMNFRIRDSLGEFWQKYRDHYLSDSRLGRTVCICLEPMIRRQHVGEPKSIALMKPMDSVSLPHYDTSTPPNVVWPPLPGPLPVSTVVEYQPYELTQSHTAEGIVSMVKKLRYAFKLDTAPANQPDFALHPHDQSLVTGPPYPSGAIRYYFYDDADPTKKLVQGALVHPSVEMIQPLCDPETTEVTTPVLTGSWAPAKWTDDDNRVSKGDPMMFNIQINRLLHASARLKKFIALGADKTGIKRKWEDRLKSDLGNELFATDATGYDDAPRDIDMFHQAGIKSIVQEGDAGNMTVTTGAAPQSSSGGLTQQQMLSAMNAALSTHRTSSDYHPLSGAVHTTGTHAGKLLLDHHPLASGVDFTQAAQVHLEQRMANAINSSLKNPNFPLDINLARIGGTNVSTGPNSVGASLPVATHTGSLNIAGNITATVASGATVGLSPAATAAIAAGIPVTGVPAGIPVTGAPAGIPVTGAPAGIPVTGVPAGIPVTVGNATVPVSVGNAAVPVSVGTASVPLAANQTVQVDTDPSTAAIETTVDLAVNPGTVLDVNVQGRPTATINHTTWWTGLATDTNKWEVLGHDGVTHTGQTISIPGVRSLVNTNAEHLTVVGVTVTHSTGSTWIINPQDIAHHVTTTGTIVDSNPNASTVYFSVRTSGGTLLTNQLITDGNTAIPSLFSAPAHDSYWGRSVTLSSGITWRLS